MNAFTPGRARRTSPPRPLAGPRPSVGRAEWGPPGSPRNATLRTCALRCPSPSLARPKREGRSP
eukprot:12928826-Prorocentrum_lima.AAC.1